MAMNDEQLLRYSRQIMLPEVDVAGQERLLEATVLVIGLGGLGSPVALYLATAGVGRLVLVDDDDVDLSNLQRQVIHTQAAIGTPKALSASNTIAEVSPETEVVAIRERLSGDDLSSLVAAAVVVVDAPDNFSTRYEINSACVRHGTPLVSGAAIRFEGQVAVFDPRDAESPCYQCLYPEGDDEALNCAENGVIAPLVGIIGTVQAMETIKLLTGVGDALTGYVLYLDAKRMDWRKLKLPRYSECPTCGVRDAR
jgi:molybdopterin/thiamine biosynthesis adenylyltransferase